MVGTAIPLLCGEGGVSKAGSEIVPQPFDWRFWLAVICIFAMVVAVWNLLQPKRVLMQNVPAPPFVLPSGCNPADVKTGFGIRIKNQCFSEKYLIKDYKKYGVFESGGKVSHYYYRFFDKIVDIPCGYYEDVFVYEEEKCQIRFIYDNVFVETKNGEK
jgi:hypothetical protein